MAEVEQENIKTEQLGQWLGDKYLEKIRVLLNENGYGHILKKYKNAQDILDWYEGEIARLHEQLRESIETPKEKFYRQELEQFRAKFHKPVIYAGWDWKETVLDALHQAGFANFEEQAVALEAQRKKKW